MYLGLVSLTRLTSMNPTLLHIPDPKTTSESERTTPGDPVKGPWGKLQDTQCLTFMTVYSLRTYYAYETLSR